MTGITSMVVQGDFYVAVIVYKKVYNYKFS